MNGIRRSNLSTAPLIVGLFAACLNAKDYTVKETSGLVDSA